MIPRFCGFVRVAGLLPTPVANCVNMDPFIVPTVPKISVVPATPDSNTFRKNIKNQNLDITSQCQNSIEEANDNHFYSEVSSSLFMELL